LDGVGPTTGVDDSFYSRFGAVEEIVDDTNLGSFTGEKLGNGSTDTCQLARH